MAGELDRQRARIAQLENEVGPLAAHDTADLAHYQRRAMQLRAEKNQILAAEKERLVHDYEVKLQMERRMLHDRLQRELAFRERNDLTTSTKHNTYEGLLNPPRLGGDTAPKTEAFLKAKHEFKCVSEDAIPGYVVTRVLGAVSGSAYIAGTPEPELENVDLSRSDRSSAVNHMMETAIGRGANAVIGLRFDTSAPIGLAHLEILAYGTAVNIKRDNGKGQSWDNGHKHVSLKEESLADMLKRVLSEEDGGGNKKKNKQPAPVAEDEVSFSQIQAMIALLATKGGGGTGAGGSNAQGWNSGGGSSSWDSGGSGWGGGGGGTGWSGSGGGGTTAAWDAGGSGDAWAASGANSGTSGGWGGTTGTGSGAGTGDWNSGNNNDQGWASQGSKGNDSWGAGQDSGGGGGWGQDADRGSGYNNHDDHGNGYGGWDSSNRQAGQRTREAYSPALDPRELAFIISDLVQRGKRPSETSSSRRESTRNRSQASPMFGWELM